MKNKVKMISLDVSSVSTGISVWVNGDFSRATVLKECKMTQELYHFLLKEKADIIVVEKPICLRNAKTQCVLDRLVGIVELVALETDADFVELRPSVWRKYIRGDEKLPRKRQELKAWAILKATDLLKGKKLPKKVYSDGALIDDVAEAVLIGKAYLIMFDSLCVI